MAEGAVAHEEGWSPAVSVGNAWGAPVEEDILAVAGGKKTGSELSGVGEEEFAAWSIGPTL